MYEIEIVGKESSFKTEAKHTKFYKSGGYLVNDEIEVEVNVNIIVTAINLYKDGEKVGYRMVPVPISARKGDHLLISWQFVSVRT